ncbi:transcriptional Coactivator p15-domain-containing protein [Lentinula aciculospora]|uniref:Transcriptional Coactivator p15-domain-containing protein n=1 Tax=Lentinula aciculospora TaxID=153920 RepID=A0A9W9AJP7_9AGAR|nr:transcriptional Coactivator p15-domain-containing protein [Lentinula aciculospora]
MVKRKIDKASDDSGHLAESPANSSSKSLGRGVKKPKIVMQADFESDEEAEEAQEEEEDEEENEEEEPKLKKKARSKPVQSSSSSGLSVRKNSEGDQYIDLGKMKRATVRSFKGSTFVDIREFYGDSAESMKPGKKGISLTPEQWEVLKNGASVIDELFTVEQKKKK